jgi:hypothetical protein
MPLQLPSRQTVWEAINIYLNSAYDGAVPGPVRQRLEQSRAAGEDWHACPALEKDGADPPTRLALRLGNRFYPNMKLVIDAKPDGPGFLFRADSHDAHICPSPKSPEYAAFLNLMKNNRAVTIAIEAEWEGAGIPTAHTYLEQDLARRAVSAAAK